MSNHNTFLELLVDTAVELPSKPGAFCVDSQALRTLLFELVRVQKQGGGDGNSASLKAANEKLLQDVNNLQFSVKQVEKKVDQLSGMFDSVTRLEGVIEEIRENERLISESTNLLMTDLEVVQEQLAMMEHGGDTGGMVPGAMSDLMERIEALEMRSGPKRSQRRSQPVVLATIGGVPRKSFMKRKYSGVEEVRFNLNNLSEKLTEHPPVEPKFNLTQPFLDLKDAIMALGMEKVSATEDFLSTVRSSNTLQPKVIQELMVIFAGMEVDFFTLLVHAMNQHPSLTVKAFTEVLDLVLTSSCNAPALVSLYHMVSPTPSTPPGDPGPSLLPLEAVCALLQCVKDSRVAPHALSELLNILNGCKGLGSFIKEMTELRSWSWKALMNIVEELHFSKNSTLAEMVVIMEKMSADDINELMSMLISIPGYVNELILSLPHTPSLSTQRLLEHLISLPDDSPSLLADAVNLMVNKSWMKDSMLHMMCRLLELTSTLEQDTRRGSKDSGFFKLLKMLHDSEDVSLTHMEEVFSILQSTGPFNMDALRSLIQFTRDSDSDIIGALKGLFLALMGCPSMRGELIQRTVHLLEKAKFVSPRHIQDLFGILRQSNLMQQDIFDPVMQVFRGSELNDPYNLSELLTTLRQLDFLTLQDLAHMLVQTQQSSQRAYEEALERHNRKLTELKQTQEMELAEQESKMQEVEEMDAEEQESKELKEAAADHLTMPITGSQEMLAAVTPQTLTSVVEGVDVAHVQEMQREIRDLQSTIASLLEEKKKSGSEKEKKKRGGGLEAKKQKKQQRKMTPSRPPRGYSTEEDPTLTPNQGSLTDVSQTLTNPVPYPPSAPYPYDGEGERESGWEGGGAEEVGRESGDSTSTLGGRGGPGSQQEEMTGSTPGTSTASSSQCLDASSHLALVERELKQEINKLGSRIELLLKHEKTCEERFQHFSDSLAVKVESGELVRFQDAIKRQLHNFVHKMPPGPAGAKMQLPVNCLSCDSKGLNNVKATEQSLPLSGALPPVMSQKPHRVYEMDLIRRHARSLLDGSNNSMDVYNLPRSCGGHHTSVDVRQTWTYEIHQKEVCGTRPSEGSMTRQSKAKGQKSSSLEFMHHRQSNNHRP